MKKVFVLLLAMVAVGSFVFAEDAPAPTYEFSANATGGWKYDINAEQSTFINDWDFSLKYHLLNDITKSKGADEGTYGFIEVTHINLNLIEETEGNGNDSSAWGDGAGDGKGDNLSITAKIISGPIEVGLYGKPGTDYENAKYVPLFEKDAGYPTDSALKPALASSKGLSVKYTMGTLGYIQAVVANTAAVAAAAAGADTVEYVLAQQAYTAAEAVAEGFINPATEVAWVLGDGAVAIGDVVGILTAGSAAVVAADPTYLGGVNVQIKPVASDALTVTIDGGLQMNFDSSDMIFTAKAALAAGDLSVTGALDGALAGASGSKLEMDMAANVAYKLFEGKDSINLDFYMANEEVAGFTFTDLGLKFVDAEGLVPGLSFTLGAFWFDILDDSPIPFDPKAIAIAESVSYKYAMSDTTYVKPYQALRYDLNDTAFGTDVMYLNLGVEAQFFPNCVFTVDYFKGNKNADLNENLVKNKDASEFAIKAKVSL